MLDLGGELAGGGMWVYAIAALWSVIGIAVVVNKGFITDVVSVAKDAKGLVS